MGNNNKYDDQFKANDLFEILSEVVREIKKNDVTYLCVELSDCFS